MNIAAPSQEGHPSFMRELMYPHQSNSMTGIWFLPLTMNSFNSFAANLNTSGAQTQQSDSGAAV